MSFNISPEEILKQKEMLGGIQYDDPTPSETPVSKETGVSQTTREEDIRTQPLHTKTPVGDELTKISINNLERPQVAGATTPNTKSSSLGKAQSLPNQADTGWKNLPVTILPTEGIYYPDGTRIAIRAAEVREIRYFSTIDDEDRLDIEEKLSYVLERCSRMEFPDEGIMSYKDLKQEDRFFIIMAIRDLTFIRGENSIFLKPEKTCKQTADCPFRDGIELRTGCLSSYKIDPKIMEYYNPTTKSFIFTIKGLGKKIALHIPSIGVTQAISDFVVSQTRKGNPPDDAFLKLAPFLFADWRDLNEMSITSKMREIDYWTKEEFSLIFELSERIKLGTELLVTQKCPVCGGMEVTAEITFPQGLRSLFVISDIFRELL
jgi:hypothetical protein